jgi:hypothetical protein
MADEVPSPDPTIDPSTIKIPTTDPTTDPLLAASRSKVAAAVQAPDTRDPSLLTQ